MSEQIKDGGPAFPQTVPGGLPGMPAESTSWYGMTMRDWFAGQALQGLCSEVEYSGAMTAVDCQWIAQRAYNMADAMLAARSK